MMGQWLGGALVGLGIVLVVEVAGLLWRWL